MFINPISAVNYDRNKVSFGNTTLISRSVGPKVNDELSKTILTKMKRVLNLPGKFNMPQYRVAENYRMSAEKGESTMHVLIENLEKEQNSLSCVFDRNGILREAVYKADNGVKNIFSRSYNNHRIHMTGEGGRFIVDRFEELKHVHGNQKRPIVSNDPLDKLYWALSENLVSVLK